MTPTPTFDLSPSQNNLQSPANVPINLSKLNALSTIKLSEIPEDENSAYVTGTLKNSKLNTLPRFASMDLSAGRSPNMSSNSYLPSLASHLSPEMQTGTLIPKHLRAKNGKRTKIVQIKEMSKFDLKK